MVGEDGGVWREGGGHPAPPLHERRPRRLPDCHRAVAEIRGQVRCEGGKEGGREGRFAVGKAEEMLGEVWLCVFFFFFSLYLVGVL